MNDNSAEAKKLNILVVVVNRHKGERIVSVIKNNNGYFNLISLGQGTASSDLLNCLGLEDNQKDIVMSIISNDYVNKVLNLIYESEKINKIGNGIAFTIPLDSVCWKVAHKISEKLIISENERVEEKVEGNKKNELIVVIVSGGYSEDIMDVAKAAGATGGTMIHGRGLGLEEAEKFIGIYIQPEKEVVMILVNNNDKKTIMNAIINSSSIPAEARTICFSIPVDNVIGGKVE